MSVTKNLFLAALCCFISQFFSIVIAYFIPWPEEQSDCDSTNFNHQKEPQCHENQKHTSSSTSLLYQLLIAVNFFVEIGFFWLIGSLSTKDYEMEDRVVRYLQYPLTLCINVLTGRKIAWMPRSEKYKDKIKDLVTKIKFKSYAVTKIGEYQVCFEECFRIASGSNETEVFVGLGTDGMEVAVKRMDNKFCDFAENEKNIMNSPNLIDSPHVLNYRFYKEFDKQYVCIVTDLKEETLKDFVLAENRELDELKIKGPTIFKQILLGLQALHSVEILHRDLKPKNIFVDCEGNMLVADFGICRILATDEKSHESIIRGTGKWRALESIPSDDDYQKPPEEIKVRYKKESDIQTLGMVFYFVLTKGKHPFGVLPFDILYRTKRGDFNLTGLTEDLEMAKDLIQWMLEHEVTERPSVEQCLKHPYVIEPEEKFDLLKSVSKEILDNKTESNNSTAIQELNQAPSLSSWSTKIDEEVYNHFCNHSGNRYRDSGTELLRLIRNAAEHWPPSFLEKFGTPESYFLNLFPTLPMIVHNILRNDPDWNDRCTLKKFF